MREPLHQRGRIGLPLDECAHLLRLIHVADDEVVPTSLLPHLRCRRARLLVVVLPVDQRREAVAGVALDTLPDVEHRAAGGVHQHATDAAQRLEVVEGDAERRDDHHILRRDPRVVEALLAGDEELDPHRLHLGIHVRVVNDLTHQHDASIGKLVPRLVGILDRTLDAVAEAELAGEPDRGVAGSQLVRALTEQIHQMPRVIGIQRPLDLGAHAEALAVIRRRFVLRRHVRKVAHSGRI